MILTNRSESKRKRRLQFSIRTLLIGATILGPLGGWYGPPVVEKLQDLYEDEPAAFRVPTALRKQSLSLQKLRLAQAELNAFVARRRHLNLTDADRRSRSMDLRPTMEQIELGMRADLWERERQREPSCRGNDS